MYRTTADLIASGFSAHTIRWETNATGSWAEVSPSDNTIDYTTPALTTTTI